MLNENPGMFEIWAHGHNGSSYQAVRGPKANKSLRKIEKTVRGEISALVNKYRRDAGIIIRPDQSFIDEINLIYGHIVNLILQKKGQIEYKYFLTGPTLAAVEKHQAMIENIVGQYRK